MPLLPLKLAYGERELAVSGLLDTGTAVNVLPYSVGEQLGFAWEQQRTAIVLSGNLARIPARGVVVTALVESFPPVRLAFAWTQSENVRLILGQANFFMEFDVCFYRSQQAFEIRPKAQP
jgi:hypothetical protein